MSSSPVKHNKSLKTGLSVLDLDEETLTACVVALRAASDRLGLCGRDSMCRVLRAEDGRITIRQKKVAYGYQVVALQRFGHKLVSLVNANKTSQDDLVISHLCGTRNCVNPHHLYLEPKRINDERTHCHFVLTRATGAQNITVAEVFGHLQLCTHTPQCCVPVPVWDEAKWEHRATEM